MPFSKLPKMLVIALALWSAPSTAAAPDPAQEQATRLISEALSDRTGRSVTLPVEPARSSGGMSTRTKVAVALLTGATGLLVTTKLHPKATVRDDVAASVGTVSADGTSLVLAFRSGAISRWSLTQGREIARSTLDEPAIALAVSGDGTQVATGSSTGSVTLGLPDDARPLRKADGVAIAALTFDSGGTRLAVALADGRVELWNVAGRVVAATFQARADPRAIGFDPGSGATGRMVLASGEVVRWSQAGEESLPGDRGRRALGAVIMMPDGASALTADGREIRRIDLKTGRSLRQFTATEPLRAALPTTGDAIVTIGADGSVRLVDRGSGAILARLITTVDGWAVLDQAGRFDGSARGVDSVSWIDKDTSIGLRAFAARYFEPGVLSQLLGGERGTQIDAPTAGTTPPPNVRVRVSANIPRTAGSPFPIVVLAEDAGGGINTMRLFHNGKVLEPGSLVQQRDVTVAGRRFRAAVYRIVPLAGLNTLRASAESNDGVEAVSPRITTAFMGDPVRGTLRVVGVGINTYTTIRPLSYARRDAEALTAALGKPSSSFAAVSVQLVADAAATKAAILESIGRAAANSRPEDTLMIFLSGHGAALGKDEWVFAPVDMKTDSEASARASAISAKELQTVLTNAPARHVVLAIDACNSAGAFGPFLRQSSLYLRLLGDMSRSTGIVIYAASRADESAREVEALGHGVFTYSLLHALEGEGRTQGSDDVTAFDVAEYVQRTVPLLADRYRAGAQNTATFELGVDFPLR